MPPGLRGDRGSETRGLDCGRSTNRLHLSPTRDHKTLRAAARRSAVCLPESRLEQLEIVLRPQNRKWNAGNSNGEHHRQRSGSRPPVVPCPRLDRRFELQANCPERERAAAPKLPLLVAGDETSLRTRNFGGLSLVITERAWMKR